MTPRKKTCLIFAVIALGGVSHFARGDGEWLRLNPVGFEHARNLIRQGRFVADSKGSWTGHYPRHQVENDFIRASGSQEYSKWHLGVDSRHRIGSKARYKFPFGDFINVHRCGLLAVKARAREFGHADIEAAAEQLLAEIEISRPRR